jgi:hypothetical protein
MNKLSKSIIGTLIFAGTVTTATAAGVITDITAEGAGLGSFDILSNSIVPKELNLSKTFNSADPITLTFTVTHASGAGGPYSVTETINNNTALDWGDFHLSISEPAAGGQGVVFNNFNSSALTGFTLDSAPSSGPRELNFTGGLASHGTATATFNLNLPDPGAGNTTTFTLTQMPSVSAVPEPETYAMLMAGLGVIGFMVRRRTAKQNV